MKMKKLLILFIFIFVAVGVVGCGGGSDEDLDEALNELDEEVEEEELEEVVEEEEEGYSDEYKEILKADLLNYMNVEMPEIFALGGQVFASYQAVTGENYTDDQTFYDALLEEILPTIMGLEENAKLVATETEEMEYLHGAYLSAIETQKSAFAMMVSALENGSTEDMEQGNEGLAIASESMTLYTEAMQSLADEVGVSIQ